MAKAIRIRGQDAVRGAVGARRQGRRGGDYPPRQACGPPHPGRRAAPRRGPAKRPGAPRPAAENPAPFESETVRSRRAIRYRGRPTVTRAFVADASVAVGWVHPAQATTQTAAAGRPCRRCDARSPRALAARSGERVGRSRAPPETQRGRAAIGSRMAPRTADPDRS